MGDANVMQDRDAAVSAGDDDAGVSQDACPGFLFRVPEWFPLPAVPSDNPMSEVKVELGRHLFYDRRMSDNETQSCASCHKQALAFSDGLATAVGSTGELHPRNSMGLANVAYNATFTWGNPLLLQLEQQAITPMFGTMPVELGMRGKEAELITRLRAEPRYQDMFPRAFPSEDDPFSIGNVVKAISAFERTLVSGHAPYDRYLYENKQDAISESAKRGLVLFNSEKLECFHCHNSFTLQDSINYDGKGALEFRFHNTGLYDIDGKGGYPEPNTGIHELTRKPADMGKFRVPSLRNVALTAPYMHDGSIATLSEVLDHYAAGGRTISLGPNAGDGSKNPFKSTLIQGFTLSKQERADLLAFFDSLTDQTFVSEPAFADPWPSSSQAQAAP